MTSPFKDVRCGLKPIDKIPSFKAEKYLNFGAMPAAEERYFVPSFKGFWGMLGNDSVSDCVQAGAAHIVKEWKSRNGLLVPFSPESTIQTYKESAGYDGSWFSDQGTDIAAFSEFWRLHGILDADMRRHKIDAYALVNPQDLRTLRKLMRTFYAVGLGYQLASDAEQQYKAGYPWTPSPGAGDGVCHFVSGVGWNSRGNLLVVTWPRAKAQLQAVTPAYHQARCIIAIVYFSIEMLNAQGLTSDQFDEKALRADLAALKAH